jgi:4-diphosphocytidyl-2-C-methyl-D-erythritol kinase
MTGGRGKDARGTLRLSRRAPAKINLFLHIVGRRSDGYHRLESLVGFTDIGDELSAERAPKLSLLVQGPFAQALNATSSDDTNLVMRAARSLQARSSVAPGARLVLDKQLPVASGIGGGSSDAAAALHLLNALWGLGLDEAALAELGLALGSDVPVCLRARPAFVSGVGEAVENCASLPELSLVLVNPGLGLPTPEVYRAFAATDALTRLPARAFPKGPWTDEWTLIETLKGTRNDLEAPAIALCPAVADVLKALGAQDGCALARMSGSGATCFGVFAGRAAAERAARAIAQAEPAWWVRPARLSASGSAARP